MICDYEYSLSDMTFGTETFQWIFAISDKEEFPVSKKDIQRMFFIR